MSKEKDNVVEFPVERVYPMYRKFDRNLSIPKEVIWAVCPWLRVNAEESRCKHCPKTQHDETYGTVHPGCYLLAEEAAQVILSKMNEVNGQQAVCSQDPSKSDPRF